MNVFELFAKIALDTNDYEDGLKKAGSKMSAFGNTLKSGITAATKVGGAAIGAFGNTLKSSITTAAKVGGAAIGAVSTGIVALTTSSVKQFAEYEQLAGGAQKIFDQMDFSRIADDANNAYKELGLSANQYLAVINDVGATFAATMGDEAGYSAAKTGLQAISDYASGTGKSVDELSQKFTLITRSTSSYQSIADQFSGILPATSSGFLEQAQAAGLLSSSYTQLTQVPIAEYQAAVSEMLQKGVSDLGLANNTMDEAFSTLSGSLAMAKSAWSNLVTGLADDNANLESLIGNFVDSAGAVAENLIPRISVAVNGAASLIGEIIPSIVNQIPALIETNLPVLAEAGVNIIQSLITGISENQDSLIGTITEVALFLVNSFAEVLPGFIQLGFDLIMSIANGISEHSGEIIAAGQSIIQSLIDGFSGNQESFISTISELITTFTVAFVGMLPEIVQLGLDLIISLANGIAENLDTLIPACIDAILEIVDALTNPDTLSSLIDAAIAILIALADGLIQELPTLIGRIPEIIENLVTAIVENAPKLLESGAELVANIYQGTIENFPKLLESGKEIVETLVRGIADLDKKLTEKGKEIIDKIKEGITEKIEDAKQWGKDLIQNFISGLTAKWEALKAKVSDVAQTVKDFLGFSEPEKGPLSNFHTYAPDMMQLFAKGITDNAGLIKSAFNDSLDFGTETIDFENSGLVRSSRMFGNAMIPMNGLNESGDIVINLTSEIDGSILARKMVKYNRNAEFLQGNPA